jgi:hypothetical protein
VVSTRTYLAVATLHAHVVHARRTAFATEAVVESPALEGFTGTAGAPRDGVWLAEALSYLLVAAWARVRANRLSGWCARATMPLCTAAASVCSTSVLSRSYGQPVTRARAPGAFVRSRSNASPRAQATAGPPNAGGGGNAGTSGGGGAREARDGAAPWNNKRRGGGGSGGSGGGVRGVAVNAGGGVAQPNMRPQPDAPRTGTATWTNAVLTRARCIGEALR